MRYSSLSLILANLLPIVGVAFWGWSLPVLLTVYWMENFIIGFFNVIKMAFCTDTIKNKIGAILFFTFHYGVFWIVHGVLLFAIVMPSIQKDPSIGSHLINTEFDMSVPLVMGSLFLSHFISLLTNFIRRDKSLVISANVQMFAPYLRVFVLHIIIFGSAFLAAKLGASLFILLLFIGLKIAADLVSHKFANALYQGQITVK